MKDLGERHSQFMPKHTGNASEKINKPLRPILLGGTAKSPEDVRKYHDLGLDFAEIPIKDPTAFSPIVAKYQDLKEELGIFYLCHGPREGDPNDIDSLENVYLPKIMGLLPFAAQLDIHLLTIHLWMDRRFVKEDVIKFKVSLLDRILKKTMDTGVGLCIENLSESAEDFAEPFRALPELGMTLDVGHAQLLSEVNTSFGFIEQHYENIRHIHVHDNRGGRSQRDDLHLPPGKGIVDFRKILGALGKKGYRGTMTLELKPGEIAECLNPFERLILRQMRSRS